MDYTRKDSRLENAIALMNESLVGPEELLIDTFDAPTHPILFVIGAQRSGTTVLTQMLATLYRVSYASNLIARFWRAPYLGALVSKSLKLDEQPMEFRSDFGATLGASGPHEFSYFWRHWFPGCAQDAKPMELPEVQATLLKKHFAAWQSISEEPLLFKNLLEVVPNIHVLAKIFPTAIFLNIQREDLYVVQSTLESRKSYGGDYQNWFGVKPSNFEEIMKEPNPLVQVVKQVHYLKKEIEESLSRLPDDRYINISYEDLIDSPEKTIESIDSKFKLGQWRRPDRLIENLDLRKGNRIRLSPDQVSAIHECWKAIGHECD
jgi:hypothetical protein